MKRVQRMDGSGTGRIFVESEETIYLNNKISNWFTCVVVGGRVRRSRR